jgi:hypothetical protein
VQPTQAPPQIDPAGGALGLLCCMGFVFIPLLWMGCFTAALFWLAKDARARGIDGAMWLFLVFFAGPIGIAIYLFSRPQGQLVQCHNCGNNRLAASLKCPHCGAGRRKSRDYDDDDD